MPDLQTKLSGFLDALGASPAVPILVGVLNVTTTNVGNVTTGTDDLMSYTVPANTLSTNGQLLRVTAWGSTANNAAAKTVTMECGTQQIMTQALTANLAGTWRIVAYVVRTGVATQDIFAELLQLTTIVHKQTATAGTQDETAAITIKCTGTATSTDDIVQDGLIVEALL